LSDSSNQQSDLTPSAAGFRRSRADAWHNFLSLLCLALDASHQSSCTVKNPLVVVCLLLHLSWRAAVGDRRNAWNGGYHLVKNRTPPPEFKGNNRSSSNACTNWQQRTWSYDLRAGCLIWMRCGQD
jgi:hypothetical protein